MPCSCPPPHTPGKSSRRVGKASTQSSGTSSKGKTVLPSQMPRLATALTLSILGATFSNVSEQRKCGPQPPIQMMRMLCSHG